MISIFAFAKSNWSTKMASTGTREWSLTMQGDELPDPAHGGLTARRRKIVQVIEDSVRRNGYSPSIREIAEATGLASTSSVSHQLRVLEQQGLVSRERGRPRTTMLRTSNDALTRVPLVGRIAAGRAIDAIESIEDYIPLPAQLVGQGNLIMLTVRGDSMVGAAIADGDWVVVRRESDVENGDIVAAELPSDTAPEGDATVKTFRKRDGHVWLIPQNPAYTPISGDNAKIIGKVVAVLRRM